MPELDRSQLNDMKSVMRHNFEQFVEISVKTMKGHMDDLRLNIKEENFEGIHDSAHPLASTSGYLGLTKVHDLAKDIEGAATVEGEGGTPEISSIKQLFENLQQEFQGVMLLLLEELENLEG